VTRPRDERPSLITGHREMDEEHALQLGLLRELLESLEAGDRPAAVEVFERLDAFTKAHFLAEELLMRLHAYPQYEAHAAEHAQFVEGLTSLREQLASGEAAALLDEADAWSRRLLAHVATADHALGAFQRSGAAASP